MHGEIMVMEMMEEYQRLRVWRESRRWASMPPRPRDDPGGCVWMPIPMMARRH